MINQFINSNSPWSCLKIIHYLKELNGEHNHGRKKVVQYTKFSKEKNINNITESCNII